MSRMDIRGKLKITTTIFISFVIIGVIPLILINYINYNASRLSQEKEIFKKLVAVSDRQGQEIEGFGREKLRDLKALSKMPRVIAMFESYRKSFGHGPESPEYITAELKFQSLLKQYRKIYDFHDILFMNKQGDVIFSIAKEKDFGTNLVTGPFRDTGLAFAYGQARNQNKVSISSMEYYNPSQKAAAFIAMPLYNNGVEDKLIGVISIQLTDAEINSVVNNYTGLGKTGETVVGHKTKGQFIFLFGLRHDPDAAFKIKGEMGSTNALPLQHALLQESGAGISLDYRGKKVLAVWKFLPLWGWGMVVKIDEAEAFKSIHDYQVFMMKITMAFLFLIGSVAFFISKIVSRPIKELVAVAENLSQGDLGIRAEATGPKEISLLAKAFNKMTDNLVDAIRFHEDEIIEREQTQEKLSVNTKYLRSLNEELEGKIEKLNNSRKAMLFMTVDTNRISRNLSAVNKELESFSYSVSHDLRSPLRALDGFSRALLEDYGDTLDTQGKNYLDRICKASERMGSLIDDMLGLSRITRSKMQMTQINLGKLVIPIMEELKDTDLDRQANFIIDQTILVKGDEHLLRIMLQNLLGNAWKFTAKKAETTITIGTEDIDGKTAYFVRDNGAGFNMEYADKLFGAFQRLHSQKEFEGVGIGLATVQRIINRHGGSIWAKGKVNQGATFFFTLR